MGGFALPSQAPGSAKLAQKVERGSEFDQVRDNGRTLVQVTRGRFGAAAEFVAQLLLYAAQRGADKELLTRIKIASSMRLQANALPMPAD